MPVSAPLPRTVELPVIMYHSVLRDTSRTGAYIVTPDTVKNDMLYLRQNGYTAVSVVELCAFVRGSGALPRKPVLITFDDGHYNNLEYLPDMLEELDMRCVISVVGSYTEQYSQHPDKNPNYAYLSYEDISCLLSTGRVEIGHHSFDMHALGARRGSARMRGESDSHYREAFTADTGKLSCALLTRCGFSPVIYAYPFGLVGDGSKDMLRELGFVCTLTCRERINVITEGEADCLFDLGRFNRPGQESTAEFMQRLFAG